MGDVYRDALEVYACVGPHQKYSEIVFDSVNEFQNFGSMDDFLSADTARDEQALGGYKDQPASGTTTERREAQSILAAYPEAERTIEINLYPRRKPGTWTGKAIRNRPTCSVRESDVEQKTYTDLERRYFAIVIKAWKAFMKRKYFGRCWIIQELCLAKKRTLLCGHTKVDFNCMDDFFNSLIYYYENEGYRDEPARRKFLDYLPRGGGRYNAYQRLVSTLRSRAKGTHDNSLLDLIDTFCTMPFHCSDVRDKAYSLLQMVDWQGRPQLQPDYSKSALQVALDILRHNSYTPFLETYKRFDPMDERLRSSPQYAYIIPGVRSVTKVELAFDLDLHQEPLPSMLNERRRHLRPWTILRRADQNLIDGRKRIEVQVVTHCRLFRKQPDTLTACFYPAKFEFDASNEALVECGEQALSTDPDLSSIYFLQIEVPNGTTIGWAPSFATEGDFLVVIMVGYRQHIGLIARHMDRTFTRFSIIGQAVIGWVTDFEHGGVCECKHEHTVSEAAEEMVLQMDPEDLFIFATQHQSSASRDEDEEIEKSREGTPGILHRLRTGIVKASDPHSSYAELRTRQSVI